MTLLLVRIGPGVFTVPVVPGAPVNTVPPAISGATTVGSTLTTTTGTWTGTPTITYAYQWKRGGINISGATSSAYLLVSADIAATITVTVTATNAGGNTAATSSGVGPITTVTWNPADANNVTFSNGNLSILAATTPITGARANSGLTSGKHYFEVTMTTWTAGYTGVGISLAGASFRPATDGFPYLAVVLVGGSIQIANSGVGNLGGQGSGNIIGVAVDLTANLIWFRNAPSGNWNASGTANPATGAGGFSISTLHTGALFPYFTAANNGDAATANFGASAFSGAVPSGFTSGWTV